MKRVERSTSVPIAERPVPMIRSPSQYPGTARSSASAGRSLDHYLLADEALPTGAGASSRHPERSARSKAGDELSLERPAALDVESLVDRLVGDPHRLIFGEVDPQSVGYLLRAPGLRPSAVTAMGLVAPRPWPGLGPGDGDPVGAADLTGEPIVDAVAEPLVGGELRRLRAPGHKLGLPLRDRSPIGDLATPGGGVSAQLPGDR